ncbi:GNAT family N-acetyltransferase [Methanosarcina hadiensis]|uniref:GNAT family N-acetyltransferase n=1 Tax=Methanosarcina hadiensis TaxID=3078083 RepID=UPI00397761CF
MIRVREERILEKIEMRTAKPEDIKELKTLIYETIDVCYSGAYSCEAIDYFKEYNNTESILNDILKGHLLILTCGEEIIGTGTLLGSNIRRIFVKPEYQSMGLGKRIMHELEKEALGEKIRKMDLHASLTAHSFYKDLGYQVQSEEVVQVKNGQNLRYYIMVKNLEIS